VSGSAIYKVTRLRNGARVATAHMPHLRGVCVGVWAGVGGRNESESECGIAHFVEHLFFKGTRRRTAKELSFLVEAMGGYLNAYTTEDHTCYYAKAAARHFGSLSSILLEMYTASTFPKVEVERERGVIAEEISSYKDSPSQWVEEMLSACLWPDHPLGRSLTGTKESISKLSRRDLLRFRDQHYVGSNTILTVSGPVEHSAVLDAVVHLLEKIPKARISTVKLARPAKKRVVHVERQDTEQAHMALGFHAFGRTDPRRFALRLLSVILGENMSSRLFQALRERYGYCYSVQSTTVAFKEAGAISVSADLDPENLPRALKVIAREIRRLIDFVPSKKELQMAKDYTVGQTQIALDSATQQNSWMAESLYAHGKVVSVEDVERQLMSVSGEDVRNAARECFRFENIAAAVVGPGYDCAAFSALIGP
jgi:predicted Zn-dependent peptidase